MKIAFSGLTGAVLNFATVVQQAFDQLASVRQVIVQTSADLPNATVNQGRTFIVRTPFAKATALDGVWIDDSTGAPI